MDKGKIMHPPKDRGASRGGRSQKAGSAMGSGHLMPLSVASSDTSCGAAAAMVAGPEPPFCSLPTVAALPGMLATAASSMTTCIVHVKPSDTPSMQCQSRADVCAGLLITSSGATPWTLDNARLRARFSASSA